MIFPHTKKIVVYLWTFENHVAEPGNFVLAGLVLNYDYKGRK